MFTFVLCKKVIFIGTRKNSIRLNYLYINCVTINKVIYFPFIDYKYLKACFVFIIAKKCCSI